MQELFINGIGLLVVVVASFLHFDLLLYTFTHFMSIDVFYGYCLDDKVEKV